MKQEVELAVRLIRARRRHRVGCTMPWFTFFPDHVDVNETCQCYGGGNKYVKVPLADWPAVIEAIEEVTLTFFPLRTEL